MANLELFVKTLTGKVIKIAAMDTDTISIIKTKIFLETVWRSQDLSNGLTLKEIGISDGDTISLVLRIKDSANLLKKSNFVEALLEKHWDIVDSKFFSSLYPKSSKDDTIKNHSPTKIRSYNYLNSAYKASQSQPFLSKSHENSDVAQDRDTCPKNITYSCSSQAGMYENNFDEKSPYQSSYVEMFMPCESVSSCVYLTKLTKNLNLNDVTDDIQNINNDQNNTSINIKKKWINQSQYNDFGLDMATKPIAGGRTWFCQDIVGTDKINNLGKFSEFHNATPMYDNCSNNESSYCFFSNQNSSPYLFHPPMYGQERVIYASCNNSVNNEYIHNNNNNLNISLKPYYPLQCEKRLNDDHGKNKTVNDTNNYTQHCFIKDMVGNNPNNGINMTEGLNTNFNITTAIYTTLMHYPTPDDIASLQAELNAKTFTSPTINFGLNRNFSNQNKVLTRVLSADKMLVRGKNAKSDYYHKANMSYKNYNLFGKPRSLKKSVSQPFAYRNILLPDTSLEADDYPDPKTLITPTNKDVTFYFHDEDSSEGEDDTQHYENRNDNLFFTSSNLYSIEKDKSKFLFENDISNNVISSPTSSINDNIHNLTLDDLVYDFNLSNLVLDPKTDFVPKDANKRDIDKLRDNKYDESCCKTNLAIKFKPDNSFYYKSARSNSKNINVSLQQNAPSMKRRIKENIVTMTKMRSIRSQLLQQKAKRMATQDIPLYKSEAEILEDNINELAIRNLQRRQTILMPFVDESGHLTQSPSKNTEEEELTTEYSECFIQNLLTDIFKRPLTKNIVGSNDGATAEDLIDDTIDKTDVQLSTWLDSPNNNDNLTKFGKKVELEYMVERIIKGLLSPSNLYSSMLVSLLNKSPYKSTKTLVEKNSKDTILSCLTPQKDDVFHNNNGLLLPKITSCIETTPENSCITKSQSEKILKPVLNYSMDIIINDECGSTKKNTQVDNRVDLGKPRCYQCLRTIKLTAIFDCRCEHTFCPKHRLPEDHNCIFDYKTFGRHVLSNSLATEECLNLLKAKKYPKME